MSDHSDDVGEIHRIQQRCIGMHIQPETREDSNGTVRALSVQWEHSDDETSIQTENHSRLEPIWSLTEIDELSLIGYPNTSLPDGLRRMGRKLKHLNVEKCSRLEDISVVGSLPNLETLTLSQCDSLKCLPSGVGNLGNLQRLRLCLCVNLRDLPSEMGALTNLKTFEIDTCRSLRSLPVEISKLEQIEVLELEYFDLFSASRANKADDYHCSVERKFVNDECSDLEICPPIAREDLQDFFESAFPMILRGSDQIIPPELKQFHPKQLRLCGFHKDAILTFFDGEWGGSNAPESISLYRCNLGSDYYKIFSGLPQSLISLEVHGLIDDLDGFRRAKLPTTIRKLSVDYCPALPSDEEDRNSLHQLLDEYPQLCQLSCRTQRNMFTSASKYQMLLNRCGRVLLRNSSKSIPLSLWPTVLARVKGAVDLDGQVVEGGSMEADVIYWLLRGPALLSRPQRCVSPSVTTRKRKANSISPP